MESIDEGLVDFFSKDKPFTDSFKCLFGNASDAIYILDRYGNFVTVNRKAEELTGFKREDFIGKSFRKIIPIKSLPRAIKGFLDVIQGKEIRIELELKTSAKKTVLVEVTSRPLIVKGKIVGTLGIVRDITERQKMEEALRRSEKQARHLLEFQSKVIDTAVVWIDLLDKEGNVTLWNRAAELISGYSREEIVGHRKVWEWLYPDQKYRAKIFARVKRTIEKGERRENFQTTIKCKDGTFKTISWYSNNILNEKGKPVGSIAIGIDVTERKEMEKKLKEYSQQLEELVEKRTRQLREAQEKLIKSERLAAIGEVAATIGHDLRNPLTGIAGAAYYLKKNLGSKSDKTTTEMLRLIDENIEYSNSIIRDILEYSREIRLELAESTPKSLMKEALSLVKLPSNIQVVDDVRNEPKIRVDVEKMKRVLVNVIKNAIEAMPKGGKLTLTSKEKDGNLEIAFADTGIGMSRDVQEKIWTPFFTTKARGMGLGLPICRRIVEAHSGNISVESAVEKGTTFRVTLPMEPKTEKEKGGEKVWVNVPESLLSTMTKA